MIKWIAEFPEMCAKVAISLSLLPKTWVKVLTEPRWIPRYVENELQKKPSKKRFDDYSHPITFFC